MVTLILSSAVVFGVAAAGLAFALRNSTGCGACALAPTCAEKNRPGGCER